MIFLTYIPFIILVSILVRAEIKVDRTRMSIFKPLCSSLLVLMILGSLFKGTADGIHFGGILIAMLFSFGGDMALLRPDDRKRFMIGLVLFLIGHIAYGVTFLIKAAFVSRDLFSGGVLLLLGIILFLIFRKNAGRMAGPVAAYVLIISFMVNRAFSTLWSGSFSWYQAVCIAAGSVLFYVSDVILAWNRFYRPMKYHRLSLFFYYTGQYLIISSLYFV